MNLQEQTKRLMLYMTRLKKRFKEAEPPQHISDHDFFNKMKKETTPIFNLLYEWEQSALDYIKNNDIKVYLPQIIATKENIEVLIMHSYYIDIRQRLYMERYNSCVYIFENLLHEIRRSRGELNI